MAEDHLKSQERLLEIVRSRLESDCLASKIQYGELSIKVPASSIVRVLTVLKEHPHCLFKMLVDVCGVDYPNDPQRFRVVYHLLSLELNQRIRVEVALEDGESVPTVTGLYSVADWLERETYDMYGITFSDHPDLRRLLTDYEFEGHPLRKDFPLTGYVEVRYDQKIRKVVYEPVSLQQDYRAFDYLSPWEGMNRPSGEKQETFYQLPGDDKVATNIPQDTSEEEGAS